MAGNEKSKDKLLYLMDILSKKSDEEHVMSAEQLIDELELCGITAERKSIYKDINILRDYGLDIVHTRSPRNGYFLGQRKFELAEIRLLTDAVQSANFISAKKTKQLVSKIEDFVSEYQARTLREQVYVDSRIKCKNEEIYYVIDALHNAISEQKQVTFLYSRRKIVANLSAKREEKIFTVNPYSLIWAADHYYLVCNNPKYDNLMHIRVDRIKSIEVLETKARHFSEVSKYRFSFNSSDYANSLFNMFSGTPKPVELRCRNEILEEILDRFGDNVPICASTDGDFTIRITAALSPGLIGWIMQYGERITVEKPRELKKMIAERASAIAGLYDE